ncbi:MAG: class I SAM-dependent methyltransferase [Planctomycetes bacterium]|nr:class I SAM-dependent methyltransferase [Planctomycetota bacterium]
MAAASRVQAQYAAWPYPHVPLLASLPSTHPYELHADWLWDRSGSGPAPSQPRVWIAGCGTFQPYVFARANPTATLVATDFSGPSLERARRRCRLHGQPQVEFAWADLSDPSTWPDGTFDLIECYGVLMNLADPAAALRRLRERLTPRGVLRLMVYPHWSRQRVFQIQRLARLCGLSAEHRHHPAVLRGLLRSLPQTHPLRHAFTTYQDSRNDAGVVDAFLHAGDRGFTAHQLGELLAGAGLEPAFWFHRPWARPDLMAERLQLPLATQTAVLGYLDLWQELRGNFVVCAVRDDRPNRITQPTRCHPAFAGQGSLRHQLAVQRLRWLGGALPSRTEEDAVRVPAGALRDPARLPKSLVLGGIDHGSRLPAHAPFAGEAAWLATATTLRVGRLAPNPLYAHLFAAFEAHQRAPELGLPDLETQIGRWLPWADPLEAGRTTFGLTPYGTWLRFRQNVLDHLARAPLPAAADYGALRLRHDRQALAQMQQFLREHPELPVPDRSDAVLRELWVLCFGHESLFLTSE